MNCPKCGGVLVLDDRPMEHNLRCVNCGMRVQAQTGDKETEKMEPEKKKNRNAIHEKPATGCTSYHVSNGKKFYCNDPRLPGSRYCKPHAEKKRAMNAKLPPNKPAAAAPYPAIPPSQPPPEPNPAANGAPPDRIADVLIELDK